MLVSLKDFRPQIDLKSAEPVLFWPIFRCLKCDRYQTILAFYPLLAGELSLYKPLEMFLYQRRETSADPMKEWIWPIRILGLLRGAVFFNHPHKFTLLERSFFLLVSASIIRVLFKLIFCILSGQADGKLLPVVGSAPVVSPLGLLP